MTNRRPPARSPVSPGLCLTLLLVLALTACQSTPPAGGRGGLPTVRDLRSATPPHTAVPPLAEQLSTRATVYGVQIPLDRPTDKAWALADESRFGDLAQQIWQRNGLRLGVIPVQGLQHFLNDLPRRLSVGRTSVMGRREPLAIRTSPQLARDIPVYLSPPPQDTAKSPAPPDPNKTQGTQKTQKTKEPQSSSPDAHLRAQHAELAMSVVPRGSRSLSVRLEPGAAVGMRSTFLRRLQGDRTQPPNRFPPLIATATVRRDEVLVMGLYRPWPKPNADAPATPPDAEPPDAEPPETESPDIEPADAAPPDPALGDTPAVPPGPPSLADTLGRALFTGYFANQHTQFVLIVRFAPR